MDKKKDITKFCSALFRFVISLITFVIVMLIVRYIYSVVERIDLINMPGFVSGTLNFSLGALTVVGTITLGFCLVIWILDALD